MAYYFFIGDIMLPIPPAKMTIQVNNKNKTYDLINEGEVNIIKTVGLTDISFDARLPHALYPFADYNSGFSSLALMATGTARPRPSFGFKEPESFMDSFRMMKAEKKPTRLVISRMGQGLLDLMWSTDMLVTLEDYSIEEDAGDGFDVTCPLHFKQYRPYSTREVEVKKDANGKETLVVKETRPTERVQPKSVKIGNEKSIFEAIKGAQGTAANISIIMRQNGISNPLARLNAGQVLSLG